MQIRYFIKLSFVGTNFHGWQIQNNAPTIQHKINNALSILLKEPVSTIGCGRTDTGVHALDFYAHFDTKHIIADLQNANVVNKSKFINSLNAIVGKDICIKDIFQVTNNLHARFSAINRTYMYRFHYLKNPFLNNFSLELKKPLNIKNANIACKSLIGTNDFVAFTKRPTEQNGTTCTVYDAHLIEDGDKVYFYITANRFLWNMVRRIVYIILNIAYKIYNPNMINMMLHSNNVNIPYNIAPCYGLYLSKIIYTSNLLTTYK